MSLNSSRPAPVEEIIHGVTVHDPYRWLEDRELPQTDAWVTEQQIRMADYFSACVGLEGLRERVRGYLNAVVVDQPARVGSRYFYRRRDKDREQACLYVSDSITGSEMLLVDPSSQGPFVSVAIYRISEDGSLLAYTIKDGGEDRKAVRVVEVESGRTLPDMVECGYARGFAFTAGNDGFFYCQETENSGDHVICLHHFHESMTGQVVFRVTRTCESRMVLTADSVHLGAIWLHKLDSGLALDLFIAKREEPLSWTKVFSDQKLLYNPILTNGRIFALTYDNAPNGQLVELAEDGSEFRIMIPEQSGRLRQIVFGSDRVYARFDEENVVAVHAWSLSGDDLGKIDVPIDGTLQLIPNHDEISRGLFYTYESFAEPPAIFEYCPDTGEHSLWQKRTLPEGRLDLHQSKISVRSKDGTQIPMMLVRSSGAHTSREAPAIMTGYGGFGIPMTAQFSVLVTIMLKSGATFALPHVRGGGEHGRAWHDAARGRNRHVAFEDFIAAAEWLCDEHYTSPEKLAIFGGSNSGLLVGAAITQRPNLFRAALCIAPLLDMARYESFDQATKWRHEYGTVDDPDDFRALHEYSPYHHVSDDINYPAVLFVSGDKDDRCNPAHVRKMAARLQERDVQTRPILVDYSAQRGHSPVLPLSVRIEALTHRIAFLCRELNIPLPSGESYARS